MTREKGVQEEACPSSPTGGYREEMMTIARRHKKGEEAAHAGGQQAAGDATPGEARPRTSRENRYKEPKFSS